MVLVMFAVRAGYPSASRIGNEIRLPPPATPLKIPAPSPANKSTTTWDAGMPEQYGTAGDDRRLPNRAPAPPAMAVTQHELFTGGRKVRQSAPFHPRRQRSPPCRGGRSGVAMRGRIGIAAVGLVAM